MRLSVYIASLQFLLERFGDLDVEKWLPARGRHTAPSPTVAYTRRFDSTRGAVEVVPQFWHHDDNPVQKGDPVIRV